MSLKPWYKVVTPREDLREGKPLDASEFAVHLDQVREGCAPADYQKPERFFERTYLTKNLASLASEVIRRLSREKTETNAIFNLSTQFGGGKTHALTLLYHLARSGPAADKWVGVSTLLARAGVSGVPKAEAAVFVGTEFDSISGRGGKDGTPNRKTPWGEIAWQLGGEKAFAMVAEHDKKGEAPGGEVIRQFLPKDKPSLILMDELMNYVSRNRRSGLGGQLYNFLQNLSEVARSTGNVVLAVSIPASELEMSAEDQSDFERFKKVLDRLGKAIVMSSDTEISEIIRRRLFEWDERAVTSEGKVMLPKEAMETCVEYADWVVEHRQQLPSQFNVDGAREAFIATYPFHPAVISVFERKWQALPRFQQTRGVLRLLALWVREEIQKVFSAGSGLERVYFAEKTIQIADRPTVTLVVLSPDQSLQDEKATALFVENMIREYGTSSRTFKSSIIFCVPETPDTLREDARKMLAWEAIDDDDLKLDETQIHQLAENLKKARRDLKETIWRTYKNLMLLGKDNAVKRVDLGLVHSSAATDLVSLIVTRLDSDGDLETKGISPSFLIRNWPPAFKEWSTKSVRDAFFATPQFPRLTNPEIVKETISRGVGNGLLAYVGKAPSGGYKPLYFNQALMTADVELSEEMFIVTKETAEAYLKGRATPQPPVVAPTDPTGPVASPGAPSNATQPPLVPTTASGLAWTGEIPPQKWMNFYTKVLSKFASARGLKLTLKVEASPEGGVSKQKLDETKSALRELGLNDDVSAK